MEVYCQLAPHGTDCSSVLDTNILVHPSCITDDVAPDIPQVRPEERELVAGLLHHWLQSNEPTHVILWCSGAKQILKLQSRITRDRPDVPKGHIAVYVGETQRKRFVVPISVLNHPSFNDLLKRAEEEFGFNHPMGGLTIPCREDAFLNLTSRLQA
ncbi:hypothetical protein Golax_017142 [Gossypium laxum]|uniref:Uncharacterized protein n=1 Tax=Gossypium laxum TaxID=34288 RepID=A0A7J8Z0U6_9ROSI|nr:hypothetical protein [Gossypium laxum]